MSKQSIPSKIQNYIGGKNTDATNGRFFEKRNPHDGSVIARVAQSDATDINDAVSAAASAQPEWAAVPGVQRGKALYEIADAMAKLREGIAEVVSLETGKSKKEALGETDGAIALARFFAGEGQRLYGRTMTSGVTNKTAMTIREPVGIVGLIAAANTPIANIAWKAFPSMICGNASIIKSSEDAPLTTWMFGTIIAQTSLPAGVINIVHGFGEEAGAPLVQHPDIQLISFTGSTTVGKFIAREAGGRLVKISLELGGKNPFIVCDDADLDNAVAWALLSAFSNAGQRCASGSRILVFRSVYDEFVSRFVDATKKLKVGPSDDDDFGPVINEKQLNSMLQAIESARAHGAQVLTGGERLTDNAHAHGCYLSPTIIDGVGQDDDITKQELFGPITCIYPVKDYTEALTMANDSPYGLTACIHTKNVDRAAHFVRSVQAGVAIINGGTYGSEPHMPFGGVKQSGNGTREPGTEAIDIYSNLKDIYQFIDTGNI